MKDTIVFVTAIIGISILGAIIAAVEISPDRLRVLQSIVGGLLVTLGASGRTAVPVIMRRIRYGKGRP